MAQEYEVTAFNPTDFKDNNGNYWCDAAFLGVSEPVKWVVKDPTKFHAGDKVYGELKDMTSKAGKPYMRFYRENRPDDAQQSFTPAAKKEWQPRDDMAIRAQWAIGQAVQLLGLKYGKELLDSDRPGKDFELMESTAKQFFAMVDRVKNSGSQSGGDGTLPEATNEPKPQAAAPRDWSALGKTSAPDPAYEPTPEEIAANDKAFLDSIPF